MKVCHIAFGCATLVLGGSLSAQQLVGYWLGTLPASDPKNSAKRMVLQANGGREQRVVLYSVDQDREPWTPDSVALVAGQLNVLLDQGRARFVGSVSADGQTIKGSWSENGLPSRSLVFQKTPKSVDWRLIQPNGEDIKIAAEARALLSNPEKWDRHDTDEHKCEPDSTSFTLYCAFEIATKRISGNFEHRDTALEEARFVIESLGRHYPHRLLGYNNDPDVTFGVLQQFFDEVSRRIKMDAQDAQAADATW